MLSFKDPIIDPGLDQDRSQRQAERASLPRHLRGPDPASPVAMNS
jgi:hypothetical protein